MSSGDAVATGSPPAAADELAASLAAAGAEAGGGALALVAAGDAVAAVPFVPQAARKAAMPAIAPPARTRRRLIGVEFRVSRSTR